MKLFSVVVLSLLFCFVKSFKSRAIRGQLKNVSAHGQAMREQSHVVNLTKEINDLWPDMLSMKNRVAEMNADTDRRDINALDIFLRQSARKVKNLAAEHPDAWAHQTKQLNSFRDTIQNYIDEFLKKKQKLDEAEIWELSAKMGDLKEKAYAAKKEDDVNEIWDQVVAVRENSQRLADAVKGMDESGKKKELTQQVYSFFTTREDIKKMFDENRQKQITEELAEIKKEVDTWIPKARQDQKVMDDWNKTTDRLSEMPITERFQTTSQEWESLQEKIRAVHEKAFQIVVKQLNLDIPFRREEQRIKDLQEKEKAKQVLEE
eukprot:Platyproteum_vivax@DN7625_c1_g1_i20.p1